MASWISKFVAALIIGWIAYLMYPADDAQPGPETARPQQAFGVDNLGARFRLPDASQYPVATAVKAGIFETDRDGNLILDAQTVARLDVLLAELPSNAGPHDVQRIESAVKAGLPDAAARRALQILHGYIAYRKAEAELHLEPQNAESAKAEAMLNRVVALRRAHLDPQVADALFSVQEAQARFDIEALRIEMEPSFSAQEKSSRIAALRKSLPPGAAALEQDASNRQAADALEEQVAALRRRGAPEAEVQQLRQQHWGVEGAQSISEMESQKLQWERRYREFAQQKQALLAANLNEQQKRQGIEALLRQHYTEQEVEIARAYDQGGGR